MAYSVVAALITSLILSLTLVPFLSKIAFRNHVPHEETSSMHSVATMPSTAARLAARTTEGYWARRCWRWPSRPPRPRPGYRIPCLN